MHDIIGQLKNGDYKAIDKLYVETKPVFLAWAKNKFDLSDADIADAWQNAIIVFYEKIVEGKLIELHVEPYTYIFAIGKYKLLNKAKKLNRGLPLELVQELAFEVDETLPFLEVELSEEQLVVQKALQQLSETNRSLLIKRFYDGLSIQQIKEQEGYSTENAVSAALSRAFSLLKGLIKK